MRHELKYLMSPASAVLLKSLLSGILRKDEHYPKGSCKVRSLYFDDLDKTAYKDKVDGNAERDKYRIRFYDYNTDYIVFEKKNKKYDLVDKKSVRIEKETADDIILGNLSLRTGSKLISEFRAKRQTEGLLPEIIIDYTRTAFVYPAENTRITIDEDIYFAKSAEIWNAELPTAALWLDGCVILEIKYDTLFPSFLSPVVSSVPAERLALSKYAMCCEHYDWDNI